MTEYHQYGRAPRRQGGLPLVLAGAAFAITLWLVADRAGWLRPAPVAEPRPVTPRGELADFEKTIIEVFEQNAPSVAHITTESLVRTWGGYSRQQGTGSGFVWDDRGVIVTNWHVVKGATTVNVALGNDQLLADVLNQSPEHDIAVLRLRSTPSDLRPVRIGSSQDLKVGQTAMAIGNPFGFDQTLTVGVVSALHRDIPTREGTNLYDLIQVDAAINPGNSGGPLLDSEGRLIGMTTAIFSPSGASAGIGFAVPVDTINEVVANLLAGRETQPMIGVRNASQYSGINLDPSTGYRSGAIFTEVLPGFGAEAAGLIPFRLDETTGRILEYGDVIVAIDDNPVRSFGQIGSFLRGRAPGQKVSITVLRGYPERTEKRVVEVPLKSAL